MRRRTPSQCAGSAPLPTPLLGLAQMLATSDGQQAHFIVKLHLKMNPGAELHIFQRGESYWRHCCCYFLLQSFVGSYEAKLATGSSLFPYLFQLIEEQVLLTPYDICLLRLAIGTGELLWRK